MYDKNLDTFIAVADLRSISKASEAVHLSPPAVMKQINNLESQYGFVLFQRSNKGLTLTDSGKSLYQDALFIRQTAKEAVIRARSISNNKEFLVRVGVSIFNPMTVISDYFPDRPLKNEHFNIEIIPFQPTRKEYGRVMANLGEEVDVVEGTIGFSSWTHNFHNALHLHDEPLYVAVSRHHPLAQKKKIGIEELNGQTLLLPQASDASDLNGLRKDLLRGFPEINLQGLSSFDFPVINRVAKSKEVLLTTYDIASYNPMLKILEVDWDYTVPYCLAYALNPNTGVKRFIKYMAAENQRRSGE